MRSGRDMNTAYHSKTDNSRPDIMKKAAHNRGYNRVSKDQPPKR